MLIFFAEKMWVAFAVQKLLTFFSAKNIKILYIESAKTVNEMTLNELVKLTTLWTTGPWCIAKAIYQTMQLLRPILMQTHSLIGPSLSAYRTSVCFIWVSCHFQQSSSHITMESGCGRWSLLLTFRVLPHWNIIPQTYDMIFYPVILYWHWTDQF